MSELYLHIGMPKTGTSFLQNFVHLNRQLLNEKNIFSPAPSLSHAFACHTLDNACLRNNFEKRTDIHNILLKHSLDDCLDYFKNVVPNSINFVSSEYFNRSDCGKIKNYLSPYFDEITIILTTRRQDELIASGYNQNVKRANRVSNLTWNGNNRNSSSANYYELCQKWEKENYKIKVIPYDLVKKRENGLLIEFFKILHLDYSEVNEYVISKSKGNNRSLSQQGVLLKLALNRLGIPDSHLFAEFEKQEKNSKAFELPRVYKNAILSFYSESNAKLEKEYNNGDPLFIPTNLPSNNNLNIKSSFDWDPIGNCEQALTYVISKAQLELNNQVQQSY